MIEDDADIREIVEYNLKREGYKVFTESHGTDGLETARRTAPDLIVLDLMLPGLNGIEICHRVKSDPLTRDTAVIMVTAKGDDSDVVAGLSAGADDYVTKPFGPKALTARVGAVLRRSGPREGSGRGRVVHGPVLIDTIRHDAKLDGQPMELTPTEFRLLFLLFSHPGRVFSRAQLLSRAIGESACVLDRNIDVHIRALRQKLGPHRGLIETVRGVGYRAQA
ncbi:MAG: response regulator [Planctomycetes bacterium]|nr:response regulator [Planctomycetota bacterium]